MNKWTTRLKSEILKISSAATDRTDKTPFLSVLAVPPGAIYKFPDRLSSVSSVGVWAIFEKPALAEELIEAALRRCDQFNDNDQARADMVQQCLALSPALQADLLEHFQSLQPGNFNN